MHHRLYAVVIALAFFIPASAATAAIPDGLAIAQKAWPSKCAGKTTATEDPTLPARNARGEATGMTATWDGVRWVWRTERCEYAYAPGLDARERCHVDIHEYLHLALEQVAHTGLLAPAALDKVLERLCAPSALTTRQKLRQGIRSTLPHGWRVTCSPNSAKMRCVANKPSTRYVRDFKAGIRGESIWHDDRGTLRLKKARR